MEDLNNIITVGEVPNLMISDDWDSITQDFKMQKKEI